MVLSSAVFLLLLVYTRRFYVSKLPLLGSYHFFLIVVLLWQTLSAIYLDYRGDVESRELRMWISSEGASLVLVLSIWVIIIGMEVGASSRRLKNVRELVETRIPNYWSILGINYMHLGLSIIGVIIFLIYAEMAYIGEFPAFSGMSKRYYAEFVLGDIGAIFYTFIALIAFFLGYAIYTEFIRGTRRWQAPAVLYLLILFYMVLQGQRFSSLLICTSYFLIPVFLLLSMGKDYRTALKSIGPSLLAGLWVFIAILITGAVINNFFGELTALNLSFERQVNLLMDRILVQQGQMWAATYETINMGSFSPNFQAIAEVFLNKVTGSGNQSVYYLMRYHGGIHFLEMLLSGNRYTGASPTIFLVLFGSILYWPFLFLLGYLFSTCIYLIALTTASGRIVLTLAIFWCFLPIHVLLVDGDFAFVTNPIYYLKVMFALFVYMAGKSTGVVASASRHASA